MRGATASPKIKKKPSVTTVLQLIRAMYRHKLRFRIYSVEGSKDFLSLFEEYPLFIQRILLHVYQLEFTFEEEEIEAAAPLPKDLKEALTAVGDPFPRKGISLSFLS